MDNIGFSYVSSISQKLWAGFDEISRVADWETIYLLTVRHRGWTIIDILCFSGIGSCQSAAIFTVSQ